MIDASVAIIAAGADRLSHVTVLTSDPEDVSLLLDGLNAGVSALTV